MRRSLWLVPWGSGRPFTLNQPGSRQWLEKPELSPQPTVWESGDEGLGSCELSAEPSFPQMQPSPQSRPHTSHCSPYRGNHKASRSQAENKQKAMSTEPRGPGPGPRQPGGLQL